MSKLFPNFTINIETGVVYSEKRKKYNSNTSKNGYHTCKIYDCFNNRYYNIHEVIIAEGLQLPKHLWPVDEKGRRYIVDHKLPVSNGGTDEFKNLHLIPKPDNNRNPISRENNSKSKIGKKRKSHSEETKNKMSASNKTKRAVYQYTMNNELVAIWESSNEASKETGFSQGNIYSCCVGVRNYANGYKWSFKPL